MKDKIFYIESLKKKLENIDKEIIDDCIKSLVNVDYEKGNNYPVFTKHHDTLYSLFIESCKKNINNFTIKNNENLLWAHYTDKNYARDPFWHNHKNTCTLCGVLYLKIVKDCGIKLKYNNKIIYVEPKKYDLLIFPGFLDHLPITHKTKERLSLQFEITCEEDINNIW